VAEAPFFRVHRGALLAALDAVIEAVDAKATIPILGNVLLRPAGDILRISGTNLNIEIDTSCELLDEGQGTALTLSGTDLRDIARKLPETAELVFSAGAFPGQVVVKAGRSRFALLSLPESDFPSIAEKATGESFEIDSSVLMGAFNKVLYAVREDEPRYYLAGVCLHPFADGDKISVTGTDGHNLAVVRIAVDTKVSFSPIIVPLKTIKALKKLTADGKTRARLTISAAMMKIECAGTTLISKLIDGTYPDYMRAVPGKSDKEALVVVDALRSALGRVCLVSDDLSEDTVQMRIGAGGINLLLSTRQGEEGSEELGAEYDGDAVEIGFNGKYFINMLGSIATQDVRMFFSDAGTAGLFKPTIDSDELYVLMPKRF
jgi:DNA polymerase-3 subunit beta